MLTRESLQSLEASTSVEWLVCNGIGGFACGTAPGLNTRRYHGLLTAALQPPDGRRMTVAAVDPTVLYNGKHRDLAVHEYRDGTVQPQGYRYLEKFEVEEGVPTWTYCFADASLQVQVFMKYGSNTTYVRYELTDGSLPLELFLKPLCTYRSYHSEGVEVHVGQEFDNGSLNLEFEEGQYSLHLANSGFTDSPSWYWNVHHRKELFRGQDHLEHLFSPGSFRVGLKIGKPLYLSISIEQPACPETALTEFKQRHRALTDRISGQHPRWVAQLAAAADDFLVERALPDNTKGSTVLAGYPWFLDWGRDTMISLPGLTLTLGLQNEAKAILRTFASFVKQGLLPNRFPDGEQPPEYNTVDASLWFLWAIHQVLEDDWDVEFAKEIYPVMNSICEAYSQGTLFGIGADSEDGLIRSGEPGQQLTWMDARVDDQEVTPRQGKAVEINALWYNALCVMEKLSDKLKLPAERSKYNELGSQVKDSFKFFLNSDRQCLFDVIHGLEGETKSDGRRYDSTLRPNQIFAASLPFSPLDLEWQRKVVKICQTELLTPRGLRSLGPSEKHYEGWYGGSPQKRDGVYHQGTVWSWLLGPFAEAHFSAFGDRNAALRFLEPMEHHLSEGCLGQVAEIFDGDPSHQSKGCFAQAWGVAETLRVWLKISRQI